MSEAKPGDDKNEKRFWRWVLVTFLLLLCMAFFSALGKFFVQLFFVLSLIAAGRAYSLRTNVKSDEAALKPDTAKTDRTHSTAIKNVRADKSNSIIRAFRTWPVHLKIVRTIWAFIIMVSVVVFLVVLFSPGQVDVQGYLQSAKDYYDTDQYDSAYVNFRRVLTEDDENTEALFGYGNTLYTRGFPDSSLFYYEKVLSLDPEFYDAQYNKAWVCFQRKQYEESIIALKSLVESNSSYYGAYQLLGDCYYSLNQYSEALPNYEVAYSNEWKNLEICHVMGYLYETKNDIERAAGLYEEALQYDEDNTEVLKRLSNLFPDDRGEKYRQRLTGLSQ
ncbi:MAG TPA: tetratricopeptide repeat protein [Cyclobacteriaceae bacterium]|nr:tetratricopeptide repeat protein [Cyclobacteriaceae bacterium]